MVLHWQIGRFMKEKIIIFIAAICISQTAIAQSNRFWGSAHAVSRANCVGTNESVTWTSPMKYYAILTTYSKRHIAETDHIETYTSGPSWGGARAWAGCYACFGRTYRVQGIHHMVPHSNASLADQRQIRSDCPNGLCGTTIAYGCSLLP
jgi:hypothetical protein